MSLNIVIMAGGVGTRLWPMSREGMPKQLQNLVGDQSLIQQTAERVSPLVDADHLYVATAVKYAEAMHKQLPHIDPSHFIFEPALKNTAPAIGLSAIHLHKKDSHAVMVSLHSDHVVTKDGNFCEAIIQASKTVDQYPDYLVTIGILPEFASTGLGYIQMTDVLATVNGADVYNVKRFVEKPDKSTAEQFVADGHYLWNAGYFVWRVDTLLKLYQQFVPTMYDHLMAIEAAIGTDQYQTVLDEHYSAMDEIAIDYAIMERAPHIAVVPADMGWSDVGTWSALHDIIQSATGHNLITKGHHIQHDTEDSLVYAVGNKLVATVGLRNVIVVDTPDVLLVADKSKVHEVKKIVEKLKEQNKHIYL